MAKCIYSLIVRRVYGATLRKTLNRILLSAEARNATRKRAAKMNELSNIAGVSATALESTKKLDYNSRRLYNTNWGGQGHGIAAEVGNNAKKWGR